MAESCAVLLCMWILYKDTIQIVNAAIFAGFILLCIFQSCVSYSKLFHGESAIKAFNHLRVVTEMQLNKLKFQ